MMIPHFEKREFKDIPLREHYALAVSPVVREHLIDFLDQAGVHAVHKEDHDANVRLMADKLHAFIMKMDEEDSKCGLSLLQAMHIVLIDVIQMLEASGEIDDMLDDSKN